MRRKGLRGGLKFTPTPKLHTIELKSDIPEFTRMSRCFEFFQSVNLNSSQGARKSVSGPLFKNKSNFYPPRNSNKFLDTTIDFINQQNLSKKDWQALKKLKNGFIVIKGADNGGTVVIIGSVHYEQMIYKQLEEKNI